MRGTCMSNLQSQFGSNQLSSCKLRANGKASPENRPHLQASKDSWAGHSADPLNKLPKVNTNNVGG